MSEKSSAFPSVSDATGASICRMSSATACVILEFVRYEQMAPNDRMGLPINEPHDNVPNETRQRK